MNGKFTFEVVDSNIMQPKLSAEFAPALKIGADVGLEKVFDVFTGFEGGLQCTLEFSPNVPIKNSLKIYLNGYWFLDISSFLFSYSDKYEFGSLQIYPQTNENQLSRYSVSRNDLSLIEPVNKSIKTYSNNPDIFEQNMQVYSEPQIVSLGDGKMLMAYIDDSPNRDAENRTILMYSVFDGNTWSTPQPVLDDGTGDFQPLLYPDGNGGAHISWLNASILFDSDVTLESMSSNTDIVYTHWNGNSFDNTFRVTNNSQYEMNHKMSASNDEISIIWQQNSNNDPFAVSGSNSIYRREFVNGAWQETEEITSGIGTINSIDTAYVNGENVIAYAATNLDESSIDCFEIFYYDSNGISKLTDDSIPDYCVTFLDDELFWINNNSILAKKGASTSEVVLANFGSGVSQIKAVKRTDSRKAIVWTQNDNLDTKFYISYYNEVTGNFEIPKPISNGDDIIRSWDVCMLSEGQTEFAYCAAEKIDDSEKIYGQIDLIQKSGQTFCDIAVNPLSYYVEDVAPGQEITLITDVYNTGSERVDQFDVSILNGNNDIVQTLTLNNILNAGESTQLEIPLVLPEALSLSDYTIQVIPHGKEDVSISDNESSFTLGFADLAVKNIQEQRTDNGRQLNITVTNQGFETIEAAGLKIFKNSITDSFLYNSEIIALEPGEDVVFTYNIDENSLNSSIATNTSLYYVLLETDTEESDYGNNNQEVYVYPDCSVTLTADTGGSVQGSGIYPYGVTTTICAIPDEGYIFDGWYENGKKLYESPEIYDIELLSNRVIEAKFKPNDLAITEIEIFGELQTNNLITFTPSVIGGKQPYQLAFYVYRDEEICYTESASVAFFEWTPDTAGNYTVIAKITDATGFEASYTTQFTVT